MLLIIFIIFLISLIFLTKTPILNKWVTYSVLSLLNELIQAKSDISTPDSGVTHAGCELAMVGNNITRMGANSHTVHHKIVLSRFINYQQSGESTAA